MDFVPKHTLRILGLRQNIMICELNKGSIWKLLEGCQLQTPDESQEAQWMKHCDYNNQDRTQV